MRTHILTAAFACALLGVDAKDDWETAWVTPHEQYSSSVGVLGCKINTNRVAYWPAPIDCDNICVELSHDDRSVKLLRIDQSEGAYDVSYDAWNYLVTGKSARKEPTTGGPIEMEYRNLSASSCKDLIDTKGSKLPLSASNSMNYLASCLDQPKSWVAKNYVLYNVLDPLCSLGFDETCELDWPAANQAECPNPLGTPNELDSMPVYNVQYGTGELILASSRGETPADDENIGTGRQDPGSSAAAISISLLAFTFLIYPLAFAI